MRIWATRQQRFLYRHLCRCRRRPDRREVVPPIPVLGRDRRDHDSGHDYGGLCGPLARYWLCRGIVDSVHAAYGFPRHLVPVAGSVSVDHITSPNVEMFYWGTILFSQTLGTALGDL
jgi:hypothetical protein